MKTKVIIFDVDGVLIQTPHYFSQELEENGYEGSIGLLNEYYEGIHNNCLVWKVNTEEVIKPYLEKCWWQQWVDWYFRAQFEYDTQFINKPLLESVKKLREQWILCYIGTDQETIRKNILLEQFGFQSVFDGSFISCELGYRKCDWRFWEWVLERLWDVQVQETLFFDDVQGNVDMAKSYGIQWFLFTDMQQFEKDMKDIELAI